MIGLIVFLLCMVFLAVASYEDIRKGTIADLFFITPFIFSLLGLIIVESLWTWFACAAFVVASAYVLNKAYVARIIGGADIKAMLCVIPFFFLVGGWYLSVQFLVNCVLLWGIWSLIYVTILKKKTFPMVPTIFAAFLVTGISQSIILF